MSETAEIVSTRSHKKKELHSGDMPIHQKPDIVMPGLDENFERAPDIEQVTEEQLQKDYADALKFNEDILKIYIEPGTERNPAPSIPCTCQGIPAQVFDMTSKRWLNIGWFEVGKEIITKRKFVEILAGSKVENVSTVSKFENNDPEPVNRERRVASPLCNFRVIEDKSPFKEEWLRRVTFYQR